MATTLVTGNTYLVKDEIKALGGKWDAAAKGWQVPEARAAEAQRLVAGAPKSSGSAGRSRSRSHRTTCLQCGGHLDSFQQRRGFVFCSSDCANDRKLGGRSGYVNGHWHQGEDD